MRIAWLTQFLPAAQESGAEIASQEQIGILRELGHEVTVVGHPTHHAPVFGELAVGGPAGEWGSAPAMRKCAWLARSLATHRSIHELKFASTDYRARLLTLARDHDLWVIDHLHQRWLRPPRDMPTIGVAQNVESKVFSERAARETSPFRRLLLKREGRLLEQAERAMVKELRTVIAFTAEDAAWFTAAGAQRTVIAPLAGRPPVVAAVPSSSRWDVGLLGSWTWGPNLEGLTWFLEQVLPLLPADLRIGLGGRGIPENFHDPRVEKLGFVADADEFLRSCRTQAIPSTVTAGIQMKTLNAIALGRPLVVTSCAIRGLDAPPAFVRVGDTPQEFASQLIAAVAAPASDLIAAGRWCQRRRERLLTAMAEAIGSP